MSKFTYRPQGVCSVRIDFEVEDGIVKNVQFTRGCNGNTQGISALVEGMKVDDVISRLKGTDCNGRGTSCPDQLAKALEMSKNQ
ncbi:MAG: TIGR03905 family TSCPD domain-containing protein [Firmicutes bacterium]|nr:TIGR03905 family TSCPD domain-containing protein [Bacillota bacterium]